MVTVAENQDVPLSRLIPCCQIKIHVYMETMNPLIVVEQETMICLRLVRWNPGSPGIWSRNQ